MLKEIILDYFENTNPENCYLPPLDNPQYERCYTGITIPYIAKYICNTDDLKGVGLALAELLQEKKVRSLYCRDVNDLVFEKAKPKTCHFSYDLDDEDNSCEFFKFLRIYTEPTSLVAKV